MKTHFPLSWHDELPYFTATGKLLPLTGVPAPKRGGTWVYCTWKRPITGGQESCAGGPPHGHGPMRFRTGKAYRRHWRQAHG